MILATVPKNTLKISSAEPSMNFISHFPWEGWRGRIFGSRSFYRPMRETFAEFLEYHVKLTFGDSWWKEQAKKEKENQHIVYRWASDCHAAKHAGCIDQREEVDGSISCIPSGPILSWLAFGYDLLCLFHEKLLSPKLINRLKHHDEFQGAWFEVAVAATILRAGCNVTWIKDTSKRNCELTATHRATNVKFGVEAKSKRRKDVLNHSGAYDSSSSNCVGLVERALGQATQAMPYILFVDLNIPSAPAVPPLEKPILNEVKCIIESLNEASADSPDKFSILIATSFGFHYGDMNTPALPHDHCDVLPLYTKHSFPMQVLNDINVSIKRSGLIPEEV